MDAISSFPITAGSECFLNVIEDFKLWSDCKSVCVLWNEIISKNERYKNTKEDCFKVCKLLSKISPSVVEIIGGVFEVHKLKRIDLTLWEKRISDVKRNCIIDEPIVLAVNKEFDKCQLVFKAFGESTFSGPSVLICTFGPDYLTNSITVPFNAIDLSSEVYDLFQKNLKKTKKLSKLRFMCSVGFNVVMPRKL